MKLIHSFIYRLRALWGKDAAERDMAEQIEHHLELMVEENIAQGMEPEEARNAALRKFGGVTQITERARDEWNWAWLENLSRDARHSFRSLRRVPVFSAAVVGTLALCIGANTTIMSAVYGLILKPLPFPFADELVEIHDEYPKAGQLKEKVGVQQYLDYKIHADLFAGFSLWTEWAFSLAEDSVPVRQMGAAVTVDFFPVLGVSPVLGRFFSTEECIPGKDDVLVLTESCWTKTFHRDPEVVGRVIKLGGQPFTIIGVAPRSIESLNHTATLFKPFAWKESDVPPQFRGSFGCTMYARLKPGVARTMAVAQLNSLEENFIEQRANPELRDYLQRNGFKVGLGKIRHEQTQSIRSSLLILQCGSLLILLLGSVNVAGLMLARANSKHTEFAVRQALGAGSGALVRQNLVEAVLLVGGGTLLGLALAWLCLRTVNTYTASIVGEAEPIALDVALLGMTICTSAIVTLLVAALPVLKAKGASLIGSVQRGSKAATAGRRSRTISGLLVTLQVAIAVGILVGASLLVRSFIRVLEVNPGFDARQVIQGRVVFGVPGQSAESISSMQSLIVERIREIPGVEKVGYTFKDPLGPIERPSFFPIRNSPTKDSDVHPMGMVLAASPEYFEAMGIRLLEGRTFTGNDLRPDARIVFVIDENFAKRYFPGRSPVGETFDFWNPSGNPDRWPMIVGVVTAAKLAGLDDQSGIPFVFRARGASQDFTLVVRTKLPAVTVVPLMREKMRSVDPGAPLFITGSLYDRLGDLLASRRGVKAMMSAFAAVALVLAGVGLYGMLAYDVSQRTREIGIRGAVGASRGDIMALILRQGMLLVGLGLAVGLVGASYLSRFLASLLFEVKPADPLTFAVAPLLLLTVGVFACWLPARRAARVDPVVALRAE